MARDRRVLVADDEPSARRGVRQLLAAHPGYAIVGECRDGNEVLAALDALAPDVVSCRSERTAPLLEARPAASTMSCRLSW